MSNLLVVDFDYFFRNPLESGDVGDKSIMLYDWGHNEGWGSGLLSALWTTRAANFFYYDLPLPDVDVPAGWWKRFNVTPDARIEISDSNMYSGVADGCETFEHVWLFDAHHDLYTIETEDELEEWQERGEITCEDWAFQHYLNGAKLHWRWPQWHKAAKEMRNDIPKWVGCDARKDDMGKLDVEFDAVSICRSGSWVPPWCDQKFEEFVRACPGGQLNQVDGGARIREWDDDAARREAEIREQMMSRAQSDENNAQIAQAIRLAKKELNA